MRGQYELRLANEQLLCTYHAEQLTLVAGSLGAVNSAVGNQEVGSCTHQRPA